MGSPKRYASRMSVYTDIIFLHLTKSVVIKNGLEVVKRKSLNKSIYIFKYFNKVSKICS